MELSQLSSASYLLAWSLAEGLAYGFNSEARPEAPVAVTVIRVRLVSSLIVSDLLSEFSRVFDFKCSFQYTA